MSRQLRTLGHRLLRLLPLSWSRGIRFRFYTGRWPRLSDPRGINEKLNWRILYDRRSIWEWTCDKLRSKEEAARRSPGVLIPEVLWSGTDLLELGRLGLQGRWILKSNNSSKDVIIGEGAPDIAAISSAVARWQDFQLSHLGEWAYSRAARVLVVERWIGMNSEPPIDYKVFVYAGVARFIHVHRARFSGHRASLYDRDWNRIPCCQSHIPPDEQDLPRPQHLAELLTRAEEIGAGFDSIRVDLFDTEEGVWFGETTPYSWSGFRPFTPASVELELGSYWTLPDLPGRRVLRRTVG